MARSGKRRRVEYEQALVTYIDILGFGELIQSKEAGEISQILRVFTEVRIPANTAVA